MLTTLRDYPCMSREQQPRRAERKPVVLTAQCRTQSGLRDTGRITDLSREGCRVYTNSLFFRVGTRVVIRPEGMEGLTGIVRWIDGESAGVEFDSPIYEPVYDHLATRHAADQAVSLQSY